MHASIRSKIEGNLAILETGGDPFAKKESFLSRHVYPKGDPNPHLQLCICSETPVNVPII